jgi:hypothetical protein
MALKFQALYGWVLLCFGLGCSANTPTSEAIPVKSVPDTVTYTAYSNLPNRYLGFHSPNAINAVAKMENAYFRNYDKGGTGYYGTVWRSYAEASIIDSAVFHAFVDSAQRHGIVPDSMHCTIYAIRALQAGLGARFDTLEAAHRKQYKAHEHAGWSIAPLLVRDFGWQAYLFIRKESPEYATCLKAWQKQRVYPVWRQPDIPLTDVLLLGEQDSSIQALLLANEFGWGFSHQGIHTWITRFDTLKECNWLGAPARAFEYPGLLYQDQLFRQTPFLQFDRYASHVVVFPPKAGI